MHTLSNQELQKVATRQNLEAQVKRSGAADSHYARGDKAVSKLTKSSHGKLAVKGITAAATSKHGQRAIATVATSAALAARR